MVAKGRRGEKELRRIKTFTKVWKHARVAAGCPGRIPRDLRRSAIRTFVRTGLGEHIAMKLSGHLTPIFFRRYDIVSEADLRDAERMLDASTAKGRQRAEA